MAKSPRVQWAIWCCVGSCKNAMFSGLPDLVNLPIKVGEFLYYFLLLLLLGAGAVCRFSCNSWSVSALGNNSKAHPFSTRCVRLVRKFRFKIYIKTKNVAVLATTLDGIRASV